MTTCLIYCKSRGIIWICGKAKNSSALIPRRVRTESFPAFSSSGSAVVPMCLPDFLFSVYVFFLRTGQLKAMLSWSFYKRCLQGKIYGPGGALEVTWYNLCASQRKRLRWKKQCFPGSQDQLGAMLGPVRRCPSSPVVLETLHRDSRYHSGFIDR